MKKIFFFFFFDLDADDAMDGVSINCSDWNVPENVNLFSVPRNAY